MSLVSLFLSFDLLFKYYQIMLKFLRLLPKFAVLKYDSKASVISFYASTYSPRCLRAVALRKVAFGCFGCNPRTLLVDITISFHSYSFS
jgi:hypothetical protein